MKVVIPRTQEIGRGGEGILCRNRRNNRKTVSMYLVQLCIPRTQNKIHGAWCLSSPYWILGPCRKFKGSRVVLRIQIREKAAIFFASFVFTLFLISRKICGMVSFLLNKGARKYLPFSFFPFSPCNNPHVCGIRNATKSSVPRCPNPPPLLLTTLLHPAQQPANPCPASSIGTYSIQYCCTYYIIGFQGSYGKHLH